MIPSSSCASPEVAVGATDAVAEAAVPVAAEYALVHLVVAETMKGLIESQVVDHMVVQASTPGPHRPRVVVVGFLEPGRVAASAALRARVRSLRRGAPGIHIVLLPFVSRLGVRANAAVVALRIRWVTGGRPVVFHCRTETAVEWAAELGRILQPSGIVADIRGLWPEELLFARGYDGPATADPATLAAYHTSMARLHRALAQSAAVLTVSASMAEWLRELGVAADALRAVPTCVPADAYTPAVRERAREDLGVAGRLVLAYVGTITRYQYIDDGLVAFARTALELRGDVHVLCLTQDPEQMRYLLGRGGVSADRMTVMCVAPRDVGRVLTAADCGLLLRGASRMNRVSMPVKLGEYLASGVPVVVSRVDGWVDGLIESNGAGIAVDWFGATHELRRCEVARVCEVVVTRGAELRRCAVDLCTRQFLWASHVATVREMYARARAVTGVATP